MSEQMPPAQIAPELTPWADLIRGCQPLANLYREEVLIIPGYRGREFTSDKPYGILKSQANETELKSAVYTIYPELKGESDVPPD